MAEAPRRCVYHLSDLPWIMERISVAPCRVVHAHCVSTDTGKILEISAVYDASCSREALNIMVERQEDFPIVVGHFYDKKSVIFLYYWPHSTIYHVNVGNRARKTFVHVDTGSPNFVGVSFLFFQYTENWKSVLVLLFEWFLINKMDWLQNKFSTWRLKVLFFF